VTARPGLRDATLESLQVTPLSVAESLQIDNLALWQECEALALGTEDQRLRWGVGVLPSEELAVIARAELFGAFSGFAKYNHMPVSAIAHPEDERGVWTCARPQPITWITLATPVLSAREWETMGRINAALDVTNRHPWLAPSPMPAATVATRIHKGTCRACERSAGETAALVTISWGGRMLSREFRL
jgi:hypothetical protein